MIIIGEKLNGAVPRTAAAIAARDAETIRALAREQTEAGCDYLDVCAGSDTAREYEDMCWLLDTVQEASDKPLCLDSPDAALLAALLPRARRPGILNSFSAEGDKCGILLPLLRDNPDWQAVALCCDGGGIAVAADDKARIACLLRDRCGAYGIAAERIHVDPLVLSLPAENSAALSFCQAAERIRQAWPGVRITAALSNISFGMPARRLVNRTFLPLAMAAGLDSVIADPCDREFVATLYAAEALLGRDRLCRRYNKAYRAGRIGKPRP